MMENKYGNKYGNFLNMESIISFLYEMCGRCENLCTMEAPHATNLCSYKCEKHLFLKAVLKKC